MLIRIGKGNLLWLLTDGKTLWRLYFHHLIFSKRKIVKGSLPFFIRGKRCDNGPLACRDTAYNFQNAVAFFVCLVVRGINILHRNDMEHCPCKRLFLIIEIHTPVFIGKPTEDTVNNGVINNGS